jgi:hypothetical protein
MKFILLIMLFTNSGVAIHSVEFATQQACEAGGQAARAMADRSKGVEQLNYVCTPAQ